MDYHMSAEGDRLSEQLTAVLNTSILSKKVNRGVTPIYKNRIKVME